MWGRFWDSFGATDNHESESQLSDPSQSQALGTTRAISPDPSASFSQLQGFSEITPNESASMVANETMSEQSGATKNEDVFSFKFTTNTGKTHRFASAYNNYEALLEIVRQKVSGDTTDMSISYLDDEEDQVLITSDSDVVDAVKLARKMGQDRVKLFVHVKEEEPVAVAVDQEVVPEIQVTEPQPEEPKKVEPEPEPQQQEVEEDEEEPSKNSVAGIPQELILPAAITFLGVVIVGVFAFSRVSSNNR